MSIFPFFVTGIVREGEFGKLRTVPRPRSGPFVSINPSYPSTTGAGGEDYKFPWVPTLVPACCIVGSTDWFQIGLETALNSRLKCLLAARTPEEQQATLAGFQFPTLAPACCIVSSAESVRLRAKLGYAPFISARQRINLVAECT